MKHLDLMLYYYNNFLNINLKNICKEFNTEWLKIKQINNYDINLRNYKHLNMIDIHENVFWPIIVFKINNKYYLFDSFFDLKLLKDSEKKFLCIIIENENLYNFINNNTYINDFTMKNEIILNYREIYGLHFIPYIHKEIIDFNKNIFKLVAYDYLTLLEAFSLYPINLNEEMYIHFIKNNIIPYGFMNNENEFNSWLLR